MPRRDRTPVNPTRADLDARIGETFLALNQIAAALALIERSCSRVVDELPLEGDTALEHALALRVASLYAHTTLEQIGDVSDTLTTVLRFLTQQKMRESFQAGDDLALVGSTGGRP
jgi:hypothetical protein